MTGTGGRGKQSGYGYLRIAGLLRLPAGGNKPRITPINAANKLTVVALVIAIKTASDKILSPEHRKIRT